MRIWIPTIRTGTGAEVYNRRLADGLRSRGHEVQLDIIDHKFQYFPWLSTVKPSHSIDVTVANSWSATAFAKHSPLVTVLHHVVHGPELAPFKTRAQSAFHHWFVKSMERAAFKKSSRVISVSEATAIDARRCFSDISTSVILNGVDTKFFTPGERTIEKDRPVNLLFVGKKSRRKGFDLVARLVETLGSNCHFTCIGQSSESGLRAPPGRYLGHVSREQLREFYRTSDFLVLPSRVEGFGYVAAEAMACGTPVICASNGAVAEIVQPPEAGIAIGDDIQSLVEHILAVARNPQLHLNMCNNARSIAANRLDELRWLNEIEQLLLEVSKVGQ